MEKLPPIVSQEVRQQETLKEVIGMYAQTKNAALFTEGLFTISKHSKKFNLNKVEQILREQESDIFLIAQPVENDPKKIATLPHSDTQYKFAVFVCVGKAKAQQILFEELYTTPEVNEKRLEETGFLTQRKNGEQTKNLGEEISGNTS